MKRPILFAVTSVLVAHNAPAAVRCEALFAPTVVRSAKQRVTIADLMRDPKDAWDLSGEAVKQLRARFENSEYVLHPLLTAIIAREFAWLNGDPGGAKTLISRSLFEAELRSLTNQQKKIFLLQFHKLLNEGVITGFPQLKKMLESGVYERNIDDSLISDKFIFLIADEVEKAHPALQTTLLSVLNERKAFLGAEVVDTLLTAGVFTSNKTIGELVRSSGDERAAIEALVDRMAIKVHVANQTVDAMSSLRMRRKIEWSRNNPWNESSGAMHLAPLVKNVKIPAELLSEMVQIVRMMDSLYMNKMKESEMSQHKAGAAAFFPPNQFSNRSIVKLVSTWKAAFIARQLMEGKSYDQVRWQMEPADLRDLSIGALLGGPGAIRARTVKTTIEVMDPELGIPIHKSEDAAFEPATGRLTFRSEDGATHSVTFDLAKKTIIAEDQVLTSSGQWQKASDYLKLDVVMKDLAALEAANKDLRGLEDDGVLGQYLGTKSLPGRTRAELEFIDESRKAFLNVVNASIEKLGAKKLDYNLKDDKSVMDRLKLEDYSRQLENVAREIRSGKRRMTQTEFAKFAIQSVQQSYRELVADYRELDHSVRAHMLSVLARSHVLAYGPPGGAKTSLARTVLLAALKSVNESALSREMDVFENKVIAKYRDVLDGMKKRGEKYQEYELFFRQFHKMVPEGEITGFQKLNEQLDSGRIAYDRSQSLSHERFLLSILDEVEKGNPALLQTLLSVLNEREVFAGHEVVKTTLSTAVLTSNKVPFEFLESFGDDKPAGLALMDRTLNKVFVPNKFAEDGVMVTMLKDIEAGAFNPRLGAPLMLFELQPLVQRVKLPAHLEVFVLDVIKQWQAERLAREEQTYEAYTADPMDNPNYYVPASKPSNRTEGALMEQFKASWILQATLDGRLQKMIEQQEQQGLSINQMKFEMTFEDVSLIAQGLTLWGPYNFRMTRDKDGVVQFELQDARLQALIQSAGTSDRLRYQLQMIHEEASDFTKIVNRELHSTITKHIETIRQYPNLFPGLFKGN